MDEAGITRRNVMGVAVTGAAVAATGTAAADVGQAAQAAPARIDPRTAHVRPPFQRQSQPCPG
ncbi:MAG TPA: NAD(P)-dependent oxidoreductase, partial [Sphingomonas sp.]|nr:NAD(P)-dependent oxidoreductase [Sphingomonas sp.]